jgi:glycosyltransferase involved in cell wall biosynthesis
MQALRWALNLKSRGCGVHSITASGSRLSKEMEMAGIEQTSVRQAWEYFDPRGAVRMRSCIRGRKFDVIQAHHSKDLWNLYPVLLGLRSPRLYYVSRILFRGTTKKDWLHTRIFGRVDGVVTLTREGRKCFLRATRVSPEKVVVIPNGFDLGAYDPTPGTREEARKELGLGPDDLVVGCTSRIDAQKGQLELLEAVRRVRGRIPSIRLIVVGEPTRGEYAAYLDTLRRKVTEYGMGEAVIFTGFRPDIPRILAALDVFALPSYEETFGNCLVEAMLSGLPCIGTDAGGVPEVLEGGRLGLLVEPRSVDGLARAIRELADNPTLRADLGRRARKSARDRYDRERILDRIMALYRTGPASTSA